MAPSTETGKLYLPFLVCVYRMKKLRSWDHFTAEFAKSAEVAHYFSVFSAISVVQITVMISNGFSSPAVLGEQVLL